MNSSSFSSVSQKINTRRLAELSKKETKRISAFKNLNFLWRATFGYEKKSIYCALTYLSGKYFY